MKIAVYTITKNEECFIKRWADSCAEADYRLVVDTGSTDNTVSVAMESGCEVAFIAVRPWRFDDARNASLALIPDDVDMCIALDADEVLQPGWREHLEAVDPSITRPRYKYVWSWSKDGSPGLIYGGDKIHSRFGYRWKHPVHETLTPSIDEVQGWCGLEIHHHPDNSKSRSQYFSLLELAAKESPNCDRTAHYLAREYFFHGRLAEAAQEFLRHLDLPSAVWAPERAKSMRYLAKCVPNEAEKWLLRAVAEDPKRECQRLRACGNRKQRVHGWTVHHRRWNVTQQIGSGEYGRNTSELGSECEQYSLCSISNKRLYCSLAISSAAWHAKLTRAYDTKNRHQLDIVDKTRRTNEGSNLDTRTASWRMVGRACRRDPRRHRGTYRCGS